MYIVIIELSMELQITGLSVSIFAFYLLVFCNFTKELLGCRLVNFLDTNIYAKHLVAFILLFFLVILVDQKNMERDLLVNFGWSILIYLLFIITTRISFPFMIALLVLPLTIYILHQPKRKMRQNYINNYVSFFSISVNDNIKVANYNLTAQERFVVFVLFDLFYNFQVFHYFLYSIQIPFEYFYNHFYHD